MTQFLARRRQIQGPENAKQNIIDVLETTTTKYRIIIHDVATVNRHFIDINNLIFYIGKNFLITFAGLSIESMLL